LTNGDMIESRDIIGQRQGSYAPEGGGGVLLSDGL